MRAFAYFLLFILGEIGVFVAMLLLPPRAGFPLIIVGVALALVFLWHIFFSSKKK